MALPPHLQKYDGLIDLLVEHLVRELEHEAGNHDSAPAVSCHLCYPKQQSKPKREGKAETTILLKL